MALVELLQSKELSEVGHEDHLVVDLVQEGSSNS